MNVAGLLAQAARRTPERVAWVFGTRRATYAELSEKVRGLAAGLHEAGLQPGDRVLLCLPNRPELLETLLATLWAGMVTVPVNWHLHPDEVGYIVRHSGARAVVVADETQAVTQVLPSGVDGPVLLHADGTSGQDLASIGRPGREGGALADVDPSAPAWLFYTSGTTGRPKGATLSHRNLLAMTLNYYADVDAVTGHSIFAHAAPLTHGSGLYLLPAIGRAATNVISEAPGFDPAVFLELLRREQVTHAAFLAPTMLHRLCGAARHAMPELPALRSIVVGGAPLYQADLREALALFGPIITQIYGQGEAPMTITVMPAADLRKVPAARLASCGRPFAGVEVRIADDGAEAPLGSAGEICVRGDVVMSGYWHNPEATGQVLRHGWLHTGDIGHLDAEGYLYLTDRAKDVIITGGSNVYPREVEEVLLAHPAVAEAAVVGVPDREWGESIAAFIVTHDEAPLDPALLIDHARAHLASFKKPKTITFVPSLPKNAAGKILKRELRQLAISGEPAAGAVGSRPQSPRPHADPPGHVPTRRG